MQVIAIGTVASRRLPYSVCTMRAQATAPISFTYTAWLAAALLLVAAPHAERLPWWISAIAAILVGWRLYLARSRLSLPNRWLRSAIVIAGIASIYLYYRTIFGRDAGVALLVLMLALKLLEMKSQREAAMLLFLGYFLVLTHFLYSQSIPTGLYLLACVWLITATMSALQHKASQPPQAAILRNAAVLLAQSAPIMLVLFVLFPRVQGPIWGVPSDAYAGLAGLSDTMTAGTISNLILSERVAFRATFASHMPPTNRLYWRGPVLSHFDGRTWSAPPVRRVSTVALDTREAPLEYTVTLEPHNKGWLFALDLPGTVPPGARATTDFQLLSATPITSRIRYDMVSYLDYQVGVQERRDVLQHMLQLPAGSNPRTIEFARELRRRYGNDSDLIGAVLDTFRQESFFYTLTPPLLTKDPVDEFLFETRSGFCEHYASAFAVLMRAAGIPARVVTGYQGGEVNPVGDYLIVRQADAHAWTEVWLQDRGWLRVDPTAAVSPARVLEGIAAALGDETALPLLIRADVPWLRDLRLTWDSIASGWNQWVLGYNAERQNYMMSRVGMREASWRTLVILLVATTSVITAILALLMLRRRRARPRDPVVKAYERFCQKLRKMGVPRESYEGPNDYCERVMALLPELRAAIAQIKALYVTLRYSEEVRTTALEQLQQAVRSFPSRTASARTSSALRQ
jgi:protein-glutamine gamma-glutamyltransferase